MRILTEQVVEEIKIALKDEFVADVEAKDNVIKLVFENGQCFILRVIEQ